MKTKQDEILDILSDISKKCQLINDEPLTGRQKFYVADVECLAYQIYLREVNHPQPLYVYDYLDENGVVVASFTETHRDLMLSFGLLHPALKCVAHTF